MIVGLLIVYIWHSEGGHAKETFPATVKMICTNK